MPFKPSIREVSPPIPATALLVDLRNFTPNLNNASADEHGINMFCYFLSNFYGFCLDTCLIALPGSHRDRPPLYIVSTGDGVLIIFLDESHWKYGYLTALMLNNILRTFCESFTANIMTPPGISFGIGIESGEVCRVRAYPPDDKVHPLVDTYIGSCINVAARAESTTKLYHGATAIMAEGTNNLLCRDLFGESYDSHLWHTVDPDSPDDERLTAMDRLTQLNRRLCVMFAQHHNLKGVPRPTPLYRISSVTAAPGNPRFDSLLRRLTDDPEHLSQVLDYLRASVHSEVFTNPGSS